HSRSGDLLPTSPPPEKAITSEDQTGQASTGDWAGSGAARVNERDFAGDVCTADYAVGADSEAFGHRVEAATRIGPNNLVKGRVGTVKQMAGQRNGGSKDAVCWIEESIHLHRPTIGE